MASREHLAILRRGVDVWNQWRREHREIQPDLSGENLSDADLSQAVLSGADLSDTDLSGAKLSRAKLKGADLNGTLLGWADLLQADLSDVNLRHADLRQADLSETNLSGADLTWADLSRADLTDATIGYTVFDAVDLSNVKGLDTLKHNGPSTISIDTIYRSQGRIPDIFLRSAGVPDSFITFMRSLVQSGQVVQFYSCFISYSTKDQDFADRLYTDLQARNVRCWLATEDLKIGDRFRDRIHESIRLYDKLLVVLSETSVASDWVEEEVTTAMDKEAQLARQHGGRPTVLFPVRLDDAAMNVQVGWAAAVRRTRHIGDFRQWKDHDAYQKALDRLLRDLKADAEK